MMTRPTDPAPAALVDELGLLLGWDSKDWDAIWSRTIDWLKAQQPSNGERGGGMAEPSDDALVDRREDRQASRYYDEVRTIAARMLADARRLNHLRPVFLPKQPRQIQGRDMLDAQIAAEGWCVSCWRYDQTIVDRPKDAKGHYRHREACEACVDFKNDHGIYPPLTLLAIKHGQLKNWTHTAVTAALEEARRPKAKAS